VVLVDDLGSSTDVSDFVRNSLDLIVEDIRESFEKYQREDVVLELRGIERAPDLACSIPRPALQGLHIECATIDTH
jgi:hypothetical protein